MSHQRRRIKNESSPHRTTLQQEQVDGELAEDKKVSHRNSQQPTHYRKAYQITWNSSEMRNHNEKVSTI